MALRDKIRQNAQPYLEPGETVEAVLSAQTGPNPYLSIITYLFLFWVRLYLVVVTDRRILVIRSSSWQPSSARSVEAVLPRATMLGPVSGLWSKIRLNGMDFWVHKRFHKDVAAADAALAGRSQLSASAGAAPSQPAPVAAAPQAQPATPDASYPANWYPDPHGEARLRYWDGSVWTSHTTN
jgi:hypothetical protein